MDNYYILILFNTKMPELGNNTNSRWLDYRLDIFQRYTLRSLISQTDGIFRIWMICEEGSEDVLMPKVEVAKKKNPMMAIVDFVFDEQAACNPLLENQQPIYFLKLDSDDMYHKNTVRKTKEILSPLSGTPMLMFCNGYIYDIRTGRISEFEQWSPPNIAVKYDPGTFTVDSFRSRCRCNITKVRDRFHPLLNVDRMVCCLNHKMNLHSDPRRKGMEAGKRMGQRDYPHQERVPAILKEFGI